MQNNHANYILALQSLSGNATTPTNDVIRSSLEKLLLPYGAKLLHTSTPPLILKTLNSNNSSPYLLWNNETRAELLEYCELQLNLLKTDPSNMTYGSDFYFRNLENELVIGGVFIRIYNDCANFNLEEPELFVQSLLQEFEDNVEPMAIEALAHCLKRGNWHGILHKNSTANFNAKN
jgi:DnaJ family protein C protein 13